MHMDGEIKNVFIVIGCGGSCSCGGSGGAVSVSGSVSCGDYLL